MPSSKKKSAKTRTGFPAPDRSPSSTPSLRPCGVGGSEEGDDEDFSPKLLSEAATKFPGYISETALRARVTDVDSSWEQEGNKANVWLSEAAMVASSIRPGSLVSVSLPARQEQVSYGIPLDALSDVCCKHFGLDVDATMTSEVGRYFAIAKVFSSQRVLKNGARLSWSLSCMLGFPATGRTIFLYPIGDPPALHHLHEIDEMHKVIRRSVSFQSLCMCRDLYLKLAPSDASQKQYVERASTHSDSVSVDHIISDEVSSPRTPFHYQTRLSFPGSSPTVFQGTAGSTSKKKGTQYYKSGMGSSTNIDQSAVRSMLKDEKCNELLCIYATRWFQGRYLLNGNILALPVFGRLCILQVDKATKLLVDIPNEAPNSSSHKDTIFFVDYKTKIHLNSMPSLLENPSSILMVKDVKVNESLSLPRLGGLSKEYALLREIISFSFSHESFLPRYKGVLLYGPPGTGKTSLACSCARDAGANLFIVNGPEIVSEYYGESERKLFEVFDSAKRATPAVVFIDELDAIAPARKEGGEGLSLRIVATLLELMDGISRSIGILVIAATNRPDSIEPALRRPGRLDREIEIGVPTPDQRLDILSGILNKVQHALSVQDIQSLASATHGFVGADLSALCNEAAMVALRRYIKNTRANAFTFGECCVKQCANVDGQIDGRENNSLYVNQIDSLLLSLRKMTMSRNDDVEFDKRTSGHQVGFHKSGGMMEESSDLQVTTEDFEQAKLKVRPSAMREVMLEVPKVSWKDVGGQHEVKRQLIEAIQWPQTCPDAFRRIGIRPPRGLLMFGPPGCSKTLLARAVASEAKLNFLAVKGPEILNKWVGESEKAISSLFAKARANSPSIIFFDEIDGLATTRGQENDGTSVGDRVMSQLLIELNGLDQRYGVTVIAATNRPDKIDPALLRPGRFDRHLDVKPPDVSDREDIFRIHMSGMPVSVDVTAKELALLTEGYSGADIKLVCREAAIAALEESFEASEILRKHFEVVIGRVQPADMQFYVDIAEKFKKFVDTRTENIE